MKLSTVLERAPLWYMSGTSVHLTSAPGRGKSTTIEAIPALISKMTGKNMGLVVINGTTLNPPDTIGYLIPKMREAHAESIFTRPFWFITEEGKRLEEYDGGIIFVDEADKMDVDIKKMLGEACLSKRLGPHKLPNGWVVWTAGNRAKDRSASTKELDHLINRRQEIEVTDDIESLLEFCAKNDVSPIMMAFFAQNPHIVLSEGVPDKQGPWCTPRSAVMADQYLQFLAEHTNGGNFPDDPTTMEEISGRIGVAAASQLFAFIRLEREMPAFETIVANPEKAKVPDKPDAQMLVCYSLAHRVGTDTMEPVIKYVDRMPKEFAVTFAKTTCTRDFSFLRHPAMSSWAMRNASLMATISMQK